MRSLVLVLGVAACGHSSDAIVIIDGAPADMMIDAAPVGPNSVTLRAPDVDQLVIYRDGTGPWLVPQQVSQGNYGLHVTNDYQVVVACSTAVGSSVTLYDRTFGDGARLFAFCSVATPPLPSTVAVTGSMTQAGTVFMEDTASSATAPWSFSLNVTPGTHDLVAVGTDDRMVIRRGVVVTAASSVTTVDDVAEGTAMTALPLTINGMQAGETLGTDFDLLLANDIALLSGSSLTLQTPPASLLQANDFEFLFFNLSTTTTDRSASTLFSGTETTFTMMPILTGITYATTAGVLVASFGTLPTHDGLHLDLFAGASNRQQSIDATQSWMDATSTTKVAFDAIPPGFDPTWQVNLTGPYSRFFSVSDNSTSIGYSTGVNENVNGALARKLPTREPERRFIATHR